MRSRPWWLSGLVLLLPACGDSTITEASAEEAGSETGDGTGSSSDTDASTTDSDTSDTGPGSDLPDGDPELLRLDIVFIIDNSAQMGAGQQRLASLAPNLIGELTAVGDSAEYDLDVNIMVTTTDLGHPLCTAFQPPGYEPAQGKPIATACTSRLDLFVSQDMQNHAAYCTSVCPVAVEPADSFIHFDASGTNVPGDAVDQALACLIPHGVRGCGFESPLEAALQAVNPTAQWNTGDKPFLRDDSALVFVFLGTEPDCSVSAQGYGYFTNDQTYWEVHPETMMKSASSAICWNAAMQCGMADGNGVYASCDVVDNPVLHPVSRYTTYLDSLEADGRTVAILGLVGIPAVTGHSADPPFSPTSGGVEDLVHRIWKSSDVQGGNQDAAELEWAYGIGPGCGVATAIEASTTFATPPGRLLSVCDAVEAPCCLESVCDDDYSGIAQCLKGAALYALEG